MDNTSSVGVNELTNAISVNGAMLKPAWFGSLHGHDLKVFTANIARIEPDVRQAQLDGNEHVIPILVASGVGIQRLRSDYGPAVWRKVHHACEQTNFMRSLVWQRFHDQASLADIVSLPAVHLRSCRNAFDWQTAKFAASLAEPGKFSRVVLFDR